MEGLKGDMVSKKTEVFIGTSGYSYPHWSDGIFYPEGLSQQRWLEYYAEKFNTVELNVTFYRLPKESVFKNWYSRTPEDFSFVVKGSRFITHIKRLKQCEEPLKLFFGRVKFLKEKLSCILWQLPPKFKVDEDRLSDFVKLLKVKKGYRHAFEFRHDSWYRDAVFKILKKDNIAVCIADWPEFSKDGPAVAGFVYLRRHGVGAHLYGGCYSDRDLRNDESRIRSWLEDGRDVYIYFNNDAHGHAPKNALSLRSMLKTYVGE